MAERVFIGLGSNVGDHYANCTRSIREVLDDRRASLEALSSLYYTSPLSSIPQPDILNGVFSIIWDDTAIELLYLLKRVESRMGRLRCVRNGPRMIDLDILLFGRNVIRLPDLTVPHPRLHERKFALIPCLEIDLSLVHPVLEKPFDELLSEIEEEQGISRFCAIKEEDFLSVCPEPKGAARCSPRIKAS